ncbi:hypothetical protein V8E36_009483 [Tilletia maclaganii]
MLRSAPCLRFCAARLACWPVWDASSSSSSRSVDIQRRRLWVVQGQQHDLHRFQYDGIISIMSSSGSSKMVIDLTRDSSDGDVMPIVAASHWAATGSDAINDESIEFVSEVRRGKAPVRDQPVFSASGLSNDGADSLARQRSPEWNRTLVHHVSPPRCPGSPTASTSTLPNFLDQTPPSRIELDSDMGDETRQLIMEMMDEDSDVSSMGDEEEEDEMPLATLSLLSPAKKGKGSSAKRARGRPAKLRLAASPPGHGDDNDEHDDEEEEDEDDEDEADAEPDSLYMSTTLSRTLVEAVKADEQLWHRILRFEPIPLEELISLATKSASLYSKRARRSRNDDSQEAGSPSSASVSTQLEQTKAWKEWDSLVAGSQRRLELAIQSWADEQGITSYTGEGGRNEKRNAGRAATTTTQHRRKKSTATTTVSRAVAVDVDSAESMSSDLETSPSKRRRGSASTRSRASRARGRLKRG